MNDLFGYPDDDPRRNPAPQQPVASDNAPDADGDNEKAAVVDWTRRLFETLGRPVRVVLTENRTRLASRKTGNDGVICVRFQRRFLYAPEPLRRALWDFIVNPSAATRDRLRILAREGLDPGAPTRQIRRTPLEPRGLHHDLGEIARRINDAYFDGRLHFAIGWSSALPKGRRRRGYTRLGSADARHHRVTVHPALDTPQVPLYFVEYIVYHELCHLEHPPTRGEGGRRRVHHREFHEAERRFRHYDMARNWEEANIRGILDDFDLCRVRRPSWARAPDPSDGDPSARGQKKT